MQADDGKPGAVPMACILMMIVTFWQGCDNRRDILEQKKRTDAIEAKIIEQAAQKK